MRYKLGIYPLTSVLACSRDVLVCEPHVILAFASELRETPGSFILRDVVALTHLVLEPGEPLDVCDAIANVRGLHAGDFCFILDGFPYLDDRRQDSVVKAGQHEGDGVGCLWCDNDLFIDDQSAIE